MKKKNNDITYIFMRLNMGKEGYNKKENRMEEIKINLENLTEEERKLLMDLVERGNKEKLNIKYPKDGIEYYYISSTFTPHEDIVFTKFDNDCWGDIYRYEHNNFFLTYEKAKFEQEKQKVLFELKYLSNGHKYTNQDKNFYLYYDFNNDKIYVNYNCHSKTLNNVYFKSEEDINNAIKQIGKDRIKKYLFETGG